MNGLCAARNPLWLACLCMLPIYKDQGGLQWHHGEDQGCDASFHEQFECLQAWSLESSDSITYVLVLVSSLLPVVNAVSMRMVKYSCAASVCLPTAERVLISIYIHIYVYIYRYISTHNFLCIEFDVRRRLIAWGHGLQKHQCWGHVCMMSPQLYHIHLDINQLSFA